MTKVHSQPDSVGAGSIGSSNKNPKVRAGHDDNSHQAPSLSSKGKEDIESKQESPAVVSGGFKVPSNLQWIPANCTWSRIKPVIRCAVAAWISAVLFVIPRVEIFLGQASFFMLLASFFSPPNDPFMAVLECETIILSFATVGWAWSCLGMRLADLVRKNRDSTATLFSVVSGQYIEAGPTVIMAVFIFLGSVFFLYIKARQGHGPYLFGSIFGCLCIDICLTTAVLFPYPFYKIGKAIILPLTFHTAISLLSSILIFPSTISAQFTTRLQDVLLPLAKSLELHGELLKKTIDSPSFTSTVASITALVNQSEGALAPVAAASRLIHSDLIYGRFAPGDFRSLQKMAKKLAVRANGMVMYFSLIDPTRERFPITPTRPSTPVEIIPATSKPLPTESCPYDQAENQELNRVEQTSVPPTPTLSTPNRGNADPRSQVSSPTAHSPTPAHSHSHSHAHSHRHSNSHSLHIVLHNPLHHIPLPRTPKLERAVGVFESQRYLNLEATHLHDPHAEANTARTTALLGESCDELLGSCCEAVSRIEVWLGRVRKGRFKFWVGQAEKDRIWGEKMEGLQKLRDRLFSVMEQFRNEKRHQVLDPYRPAFDTKADPEVDQEVPPHRHLFNCYVYQYHLLQFAEIAVDMLDEIIRLETERRQNRLWTPVQKIFKWNNWELSENAEHDDDENPDTIQGLEPAWMADLGIPHRRDPDALPPRNIFEWVMNHLYRSVTSLGGGNALFAVKAGLLTVILCIPSFLKSSGFFAYRNRFVWAIFMGQLTLARFRGDTTWGLVTRILSTFGGCVVGIAMWYISCGSGRGNAIGFAAVCGVCFPFFFYGRLYWPGPPMTNIIFFVTAILVVGYSYQDVHIVLPGSQGYGVTVAWRRFVLVTIGVVAAFIFSFFPPSTTIRCYQRRTLATASSEIGAIYCLIVSFANSRKDEDSQEILASLIAVRSKLNRSVVLRTNVIYEFSLRGRWPAKRYHTILDIQLQLAYLLSHLMSVVERLEPAWSSAFLRRTRFLDSDFQGDVLAVITMISTSLRTGDPLPQITPCPLLDRFMVRVHGLNVIHEESEDDYGLPRTLTLSTLENEQYLIFCVGVSTAFGIVTRLDRLMVAVKEIVGEQYHIHGVGLVPMSRNGGVELGARTSSVPFRPPADV